MSVDEFVSVDLPAAWLGGERRTDHGEPVKIPGAGLEIVLHAPWCRESLMSLNPGVCSGSHTR